uniref:titin n=1 Tax=Anopheles coluzzii TaxID=1518534 RepID=UPI0020FFE625|nr:titin [Anopheles coluzzii]
MKREVKMFSIRGANILILNKESGEQTRKIAVKTDRVTIGAHPLNSIRLHTLEAERLHCKLFADSSNSVTIHNFSVRNPVLLNGVRLEGKTVIQNGDKFEVAGYLFEWNYNPANINAVRKSTKRATCLPSVGKPKTLKRVRSFGELVKQCSVKVPRDVGLMLNAIRKRRTIHSIIVPSLNRSPESDGTHENVHLTDNSHAQADTTMQMELNAANPVATPNEISTIEKENVTLRHEIPKLQTTGVMLTSYVSLAEKRHLTCKTPVASPKRTPLRHKNATFDKTEIEEYLVNVSNPHDSMHLIDLTTPIKSRPPSAVRKVFSGKVAQSPRVLDAINLISPSPKKVNRTPNSVKAVAPSTPKVALLKSAIKNSRIHASDTKKTPLASSLSNKKTPNVKINSSVRTDTHKVTPISSKTSAVKLRKHLISSLNKKDSSGTPVPIITAEAPTDPNTTPIPIVTTETVSKHSTPVPESIPRDQQSLQSVIPEYKDEIIANVVDTGVEDTAVVIPMFDVQSVIKKPNRTTQIRSAKYSDVTPHESFMDGVTPAVVPPEDNALVLHADINEPVRSNTLNEELKNVNDVPTCTRLNRNSCLPISTAQLTPQPTKSRKTFSALDYNSLSVSPMSRVSIPEDPIIDLDLDSELSSLDDHVNEDELLASSDSEPVHDIEILPAKVSTPQLRDSLRDTRKFIGSAFTSLNTSRPQLDLTAEIDESLLINEEEEPDHGNNEMYNMQAAHESELPNEQIISNALVVSDDTATPMETKPKSSSASILSNSMRECFSSKHSKINDNRRNTLSTAVLQDSSRGLTKEDINCVSQYMKTTPSEEEPKHVSDVSVHEQLQPVDADLDYSKNMLNPAADSNQLSPNYSLKIIPKTPTRLPESANEHVSETKMLLSTPKIADEYIQENRENMFSTPKAIESSEVGCDRVSTCINLIGVKEMLKTPKVSHSDVNYCHAMENMFRTPKSVVSSETEKENSFANVECNEELHNTLPEGQSDGQDCEEIQHGINAEPTSPSAELVDIDKMKELSSTPKSISFADADRNDSSCIDLEDSVDPLSSAVDIEGNRQVEEIPSTPKPISSIDEDQNELSCADLVEAEDVEMQELNRTPKPISSIDADKNESVCIELAVADDSLSPAATVEDTCEVEKIPDEQPSASTCTDLADVVEDVASTGNIEENDEVNELNRTPKAILSMQVENEKQNCVNLVGVKELLKTPKNCNADDADYRELQDMFKTPKPSSRITAKGSETCVSLVGVKELLKTPKNIDMDASNLSAIQNMLKTPKPVSCDDADSNESVCAVVEHVEEEPGSPCADIDDNCKVEAIPKTPKAQSASVLDQNKSTCVDISNDVQPASPSTDIEHHVEVEAKELLQTPNLTRQSGKEDQNCGNLVGVKELLKTPKNSNIDDADYRELQDLFKTPKPCKPAISGKAEDPIVNLVGVKELLKTPKTTHKETQDSIAMQNMFKTPKATSSVETSTDKAESSFVNLVGVKELLKTPKNSVTETQDLSDMPDMFKTPKPIAANKLDNKKSVKHDDSGKESVEMAKEETKLDPATPTRTMRKRKLYSRKYEELKTPDNLTAPSPQRGVSDAEYLNILKLPVAKENILTEKFSESPARRDMPKRTCRQKIESLSEEVLAGKSPAPKYCKPPAQKEDAATPIIKEEVDALLTIRRVAFVDVVNVKEFNSPNIVGDVIKNVNRQPRGRKRITEAHDSLNSSEEATEQVVENVKRKRGRPAMVKENLEQQKAVATGGSQRITESNATSESEDLVSDQQSSDVTNEDMGLVDTETKEKNEDEQPTDVAGIEQKLPRRRQQTKGLKSASATKHILSEESVNENDTPVKKRGRTQKKASEVDVLAETSNSTPLRRGRPKKALQIVEETASTDNQNNETDKLAQDETKSVDEKANVEVNNVTESGKEEQDIVKPVVKGRRRKIEAHKEENTVHKSAETVQEATKPASRGRRRKVEEPQEKELEKEVSETVQDQPKVVGRGRRRKIEAHNEDEAVKEDVVAVAQQTTKPVARGRRRKIEEHNDEEPLEKVTEDVQDSSKSVDKTPQRNTEVCVEEDSAKVDVAVAQNETKPVRKGGRRKQELIKAEDTESEDASVIKDEVKPVGKGRRRKVEVQTKEESTEVKAVKGRRRKIEVPAEEVEPQKVEEKHEPSETPKRGKSETVVVSGSQQDTGEQKHDQETSAKTTTKARKTAKKDEASNTDDSVAVENAADSSPKTETRPVRRTRAKRN